MAKKQSTLQMPVELINDMNNNLPGDLRLSDLQVLFKDRPFKIIMIMNKALMESDLSNLELSVRSANVLRRAGFMTVGDIVNGIDSFDDLKKLRNCGATSLAEIRGRMFFYQYSLIPKEKRKNYLMRVLALNGIK